MLGIKATTIVTLERTVAVLGERKLIAKRNYHCYDYPKCPFHKLCSGNIESKAKKCRKPR